MSAHVKKALFPATVIAADTTTTGDEFILHPHAREIIIESIVSSRTDGTFTATLQHSPDGTTFTNVLMADGSTAFAGAAQSANGTVFKFLLKNTPIFQRVRISILSSSTTSGATVECNLYHGVQR